MRLLSFFLLIAAACTSNELNGGVVDGPGKEEAAVSTQNARVTYTSEGEPEGLHRFFRWSNRLVQGAQPAGDVAFRNLAAMGVTTIISVDGAAPDIEAAHKYGLRYVHAPIGYDGIPRERALQIIAAAQRSKGDVYIHCHHGKHRGPAGMMVVRLTLEGISHADAVDALKKSGTSPKYEGLYRGIREFEIPTADELATVSAELPERVMPAGMRATMVDVSNRWEQIKSSHTQDWKVPQESPDISPPHEARMLWELFRESSRTGQWKSYGETDEFKQLLASGEQAAIALEHELRAGDLVAADKSYVLLKKNCNACHAQFRN